MNQEHLNWSVEQMKRRSCLVYLWMKTGISSKIHCSNLSYKYNAPYSGCCLHWSFTDHNTSQCLRLSMRETSWKYKTSSACKLDYEDRLSRTNDVSDREIDLRSWATFDVNELSVLHARSCLHKNLHSRLDNPSISFSCLNLVCCGSYSPAKVFSAAAIDKTVGWAPIYVHGLPFNLTYTRST